VSNDVTATGFLAQLERLRAEARTDRDVGRGTALVQARRRTSTADQRRQLYDLYLRRHDRIDNWDLVDRAAPWVLGGYLADKDRAPLYTLARSADQRERRSAIVATYFFIRNNELDDTFAIAEVLVHDEVDLVQKAVGGWLREAGKRDPARLRAFLDEYAATMPRTPLRYAIEHFEPTERRHYMDLRPTKTDP
jgi:3-methyladenine DNA glycosylase AlkD